MARSDPYLFNRQKRLLVLLDALGGDIRSTDFQKLLLLYCHSCTVPPYEFVPYTFGAFSFTSYAGRRKLVKHGLLEDQDKSWTLTDRGRALSKKLQFDGRDAIFGFARRTRNLRGDVLVAKTYRRFPYTAIHSEIAGRVLDGDDDALQRIADAKVNHTSPGIATIGYEGRSLEGYLNLMIRDGITLLCDVRRNPLSRRYGFAKKTLAKACDRVGIRYEHLPQFGISSADRKGLRSQADYDALFRAYEAENLPARDQDFAIIQAWVTSGERVALTCFEREPHRCHRHCVSDALETRMGVSASHL
jgi:hypothetical protein